MIEPVEQQLFASNQRTEQVTTWDVDYPAGTLFNFYIQTVGKCCGYGTYKHFAWAPEPPGCDCTCRGLEGGLNINPNNSPDNEFTLTTGGGRTITRDDLHSNSPHDGKGVYYTGKATYMRVKPKGNGNQNTLLMDGVVYLLENKETYVIEGDLDVVIYNDRVNSGGKAMGHWWVNTGSGCAKLRKNAETHDERCPKHPANAAALAAVAIPYFDNPTSSYHGAYDKTTGNPFCMITELQPGREWLLRFEDLPGASSDWDYNDVVISVELLKNDGVTASVQHIPFSGTVDLNRGTGWRASVVLADGTMMTDSDMRAYDGKVASLWFRPQGSGSQTISVNGSDTAFSNASMVSLCSADMTVRIYQSGSTWKADFSTTKGFYTVFQ
jgi:hypothetical protein